MKTATRELQNSLTSREESPTESERHSQTWRASGFWPSPRKRKWGKETESQQQRSNGAQQLLQELRPPTRSSSPVDSAMTLSRNARTFTDLVETHIHAISEAHGTHTHDVRRRLTLFTESNAKTLAELRKSESTGNPQN
jgi:hypothetical protein